MSKTDTSEKGFESLIMRHMTHTDGVASGIMGVGTSISDSRGDSVTEDDEQS